MSAELPSGESLFTMSYEDYMEFMSSWVKSGKGASRSDFKRKAVSRGKIPDSVYRGFSAAEAEGDTHIFSRGQLGDELIHEIVTGRRKVRYSAGLGGMVVGGLVSGNVFTGMGI